MDVDLVDHFEETIEILGDRIEAIERTLCDDEEFCCRDIDSTYQAALKYVGALEEKCRWKLNEIQSVLEQIREENTKVSKQNKKEFDDEMEVINEVFSQGEHREALEKLQTYEKRFEQRKTIIQTIPKLSMNAIDLDQYLSLEKSTNHIQTPSSDEKQNSFEAIKPAIKTRYYLSRKPVETDSSRKEDDDSERELNKSPSTNVKRLDNQQIVTNSNRRNSETKSPPSATPTRSIRFSTRLSSTSASPSSPVVERELITPSSTQITARHVRENAINRSQVQSVSSSPSAIERQSSTTKISKREDLNLTEIAPYQHYRDKSLLMACNKDYIVLYRCKSDPSIRWSLSVYDRSNPVEQNLNWYGQQIISLGYLNKANLYMFTDSEFIMYSLNTLSKLHWWPLSADGPNSEYKYIDRYFGTVYQQNIYQICFNDKFQWILSVFDLETVKHLSDYNLTENFPDVRRCIHVCIHEKLISFLVQMDGPQYAVIFCSNNKHFSFEKKGCIYLSYAENPLAICFISAPYLSKALFFINDPSARIIHILTDEKYLQSYSIIAYTLEYNEENKELVLASDRGIYAINLLEQQTFFSKFY